MAKTRSPSLSQRTLVPPATDRASRELVERAGAFAHDQKLRTPPSELRTCPELVERIERADHPPLSLAEKRLFLAHLVRLNLVDCLDDSGTFDLTRARQFLSGGVVQQLTVDETTRIDRAGNPVTRRKITVRLVDKLRAIKLDDALETSERRTRAVAEEQRAKAEQAAQESQARAAAYQQYADIDKEVDRRVWAAVHRIFKDDAGHLLSGVTIETLNDALRNVSRHPRPPP